MKTSLMMILFFSFGAYAGEKKVDMRQGTKAVDEKYLDAMTSDEPSRKTISHDVRINQDRTQQVEGKRGRQFQEERPEAEAEQP